MGMQFRCVECLALIIEQAARGRPLTLAPAIEANISLHSRLCVCLGAYRRPTAIRSPRRAPQRPSQRRSRDRSRRGEARPTVVPATGPGVVALRAEDEGADVSITAATDQRVVKRELNERWPWGLGTGRDRQQQFWEMLEEDFEELRA